MAHDILIFDRSYVAAAQLNQYSAVKLDTNGKAAAPGAGGFCVGVVQNGSGAVPGTPGTVASGAIAEVRVHGVTKMMVGSGAGVTAGDLIRVDTSGNAVTWATGSNYYAIGIAEETAAASTLVSVLLLPNSRGT